MRKILYLVSVVLFAFSCAKDNSTLMYPENNPNCSIITIDSPTKTLSIDFGDSFNFTPKVSQTIEGKPLEYTWTANEIKSDGDGDQFVIGKEATLKHRFNKFGRYKIRLEVKNESGSAFKTWESSVRVYDEGLFVVGRNQAGDCNFAFARTLSETEINDGVELVFAEDVLRKANPDVDIKNIIRIQKRIVAYNKPTPNLFIYCEKVIYEADGNTFEIINSANIEDYYQGEKIIAVTATDDYLSSALVYTEKGNSYQFSLIEFVFVKNTMCLDGFDVVYPHLLYEGGLNNMYMDKAWVTNSPEPKIWLSGGYYQNYLPINNTFANDTTSSVDGSRPNIYAGRDILVVTQMNGNSFSNNANLFAISISKTNDRDVKITEFGLPGYAVDWTDIGEVNYVSAGDVTFKKGSPIVSNGRYQWIAYSDGSKLYCWFPKAVSSGNHLPSNAAVDLGTGKEVTALAISYDMKKIYVAYYDNNKAGELKGGLAIYSASTFGITPNLQPEQLFEGITTRPIQVGYKALKQGKYVSE